MIDMTTITGAAHRYADMFPMLPEPELAELAESIAANGLRDPIVITADGLILDGRNRFEACRRSGVEPSFVIYDGDDDEIAAYVINKNVHRRHMSPGVRAMATALVLHADGRRHNGRWLRGSVDISQSSNTASAWQSSLHKAGVILDHQPGHTQWVIDGVMSLDAAFKRADEARKNQAEAATDEQPPDVGVPSNPYDETSIEDAADLARAYGKVKREREQRERDERVGRFDNLAKAMYIAADYGRRLGSQGVIGGDPISGMMSEYDPAELGTWQLDNYLQVDQLEDALRFVQALIEWRKGYDAAHAKSREPSDAA